MGLCPDGGQPVGIDAYGNNICPSYGNASYALGGQLPNRTREHARECDQCIDNCWGIHDNCEGCHSFHPGGQCGCNQICTDWWQGGINCDTTCLQNGGTFEECCPQLDNIQCNNYEWCCWGMIDTCFDDCVPICKAFGGYSGERNSGRGDFRKGGRIKRANRKRRGR